MSSDEYKTEEQSTTIEHAPKKDRVSVKKIAVTIVVVAIITAGVVFAIQNNAFERVNDYFASQKQVASVNGSGITQGELEKILEQVAPGQTETLDDAVRTQVLEDLVNVRLLVTTAQEKGHTTTEEAVQTKFDELVEQVGGRESFDKQIATVGVTEKEIRKNVREELLMQMLLDAETEVENITVTDEEVKKTYDEAVAFAKQSGVEQEIPPMDAVRDTIVAQIEQQKRGEIVQAYIDTLRETADIKILI